MKPIITMCNYYGMCDEQSNPVGHTVKVTNEYASILKERYAVNLVASPCIVQNCNNSYFEQLKKLRYNISISGNGVIKRIVDKFKLIININQAIGNKGIYFFYQVDFFFFFYMFFFYRKKKNRKILCLMYHQDFTGGQLEWLLQVIYEHALRKLDGVIYTQKGNPVPHDQTVWIPDFFYIDNQYAPYQIMEKKDRVVCVGTMNRYKQLEELVSAFAGKKTQLVIAGKFDDLERNSMLLKVKTDNIKIQNKNLSYDEYLKLLATSRYSIMPYDMRQYVNRTSGVLLESIYVGSIPIAPQELLTQNGLPGIGYKSLMDLFDNENEKQWETDFDFQSIYLQNDARRFCDFIGKWTNECG